MYVYTASWIDLRCVHSHINGPSKSSQPLEWWHASSSTHNIFIECLVGMLKKMPWRCKKTPQKAAFLDNNKKRHCCINSRGCQRPINEKCILVLLLLNTVCQQKGPLAKHCEKFLIYPWLKKCKTLISIIKRSW